MFAQSMLLDEANGIKGQGAFVEIDGHQPPAATCFGDPWCKRGGDEASEKKTPEQTHVRCLEWVDPC
jgi:hypothetical protein